MEQAPIDLLALLNRAVALQFENQHQAAIDCYDQALHIQANNPKAWFQRGIALEALFKFEDANSNHYQTRLCTSFFA